MSKVLPFATVLAIAGALVLPSVSSAQAPTQDSVTGSGTAGFEYEIDVRSGPSGENPTGRVDAASFGTPFFGGEVTCLVVRGNVATMNINDDVNGFDIVSIRVTDSGASDIVDVGLGRAPGDCSPFDPVVTATTTSGNFVVVDAPPLPTSKDQCKNGGWRTYGVFRNQGDCVSFVAKGDRNQPAG